MAKLLIISRLICLLRELRKKKNAKKCYHCHGICATYQWLTIISFKCIRFGVVLYAGVTTFVNQKNTREPSSSCNYWILVVVVWLIGFVIFTCDWYVRVDEARMMCYEESKSKWFCGFKKLYGVNPFFQIPSKPFYFFVLVLSFYYWYLLIHFSFAMKLASFKQI